jgi:TonB family protein
MHSLEQTEIPMHLKNVVAILVPSVLLGACASERAGMTPEPQAPTVPSGETELTLVNPHLPSADEHLTQIREDVGDVASARVRFCIAPDGHVDSVNMLHRSSSPLYDWALMQDVARWQFAGEERSPSPSETCETATISYRVPV